mgnify:CR=1 FL=1
MKVKSGLKTDGVFTKVINDLIVKDSCLDESYVCIILILSNNSDNTIIPTVKIHNDIRQYLCPSKKNGYVSNLSCSHQNIENSEQYYIKFNLNDLSEDNRDETIYKLSCSIGLKHKCSWCAYVHNGVIRNIQLHY